MVEVQDTFRMIPAYGVPEAEELPMFAENRVHQRSSGNPYPNRVVMEVDREHREDRRFRVIVLENEYLKLELLPELGGRIYTALDKRNGYDFFYHQHVIKPALIGLLGSWISGGVEFNWPCHHRPGTFMPVDVLIEREPDGAVTVWMSENDPFDRMQGMVGIHLAPGEARFDTRMKVYNRTPSRHSFLWWENAAIPVNPDYRLVFPPDVRYVQFHYRKDVTGYPVAGGVYNGQRLGDVCDISRHGNTKRPTSYFCAATKYDFFGGYDPARQAGVIHVAPRSVSTGKKMFTWAYNQLSRSWEKALTDTDGPYAELMASSYSLNQPDFTWLMPYEMKKFHQSWYPVGALGVPICACAEAAVAAADGKLRIQSCVSLRGASVEIGGRRYSFNLTPEDIFEAEDPEAEEGFILRDAAGKVLLRYRKSDPAYEERPATIPDNPALSSLGSAQEAYLMGVHVAQYRDPSIRPDVYYREALSRDPDYSPALTAMAEYELEHFRTETALTYAKHAWRIETKRNFHPESGRLQYVMGRIYEAMDQDEKALEWYLQAAWAQDTRSRAMTRASMICARRGDAEEMLEYARAAREAHSDNLTARILEYLALRRMQLPEAEEKIREIRAMDALDVTVQALDGRAQEQGMDPCQSALDAAQDLWRMGESALAAEILERLDPKCAQTEYARSWLLGDSRIAAGARGLETGIAWPSRELEYRALREAVRDPRDAAARRLLGDLLYANGNWTQADVLWAEALEIDEKDAECWRNRAVAAYSHLNRKEEAPGMLERALRLCPGSQQLIWEKAYLMNRMNRNGAEIDTFLRASGYRREDICVEHAKALNRAGEYEKALEVLLSRTFTPCEGGEHSVAEQYMFACHALGRKCLKDGKTDEALRYFRRAQELPDSLGAGLWNEVLLVPHRYMEAICLEKLGRGGEAGKLYDFILLLKPDYFSDMNLPELPCWQAMACFRLGRYEAGRRLLAGHRQAQDASEFIRGAGYAGTTPFFISYMENPETVRAAGREWQLCMIDYAEGRTEAASARAKNVSRMNPVQLYAALIAREL